MRINLTQHAAAPEQGCIEPENKEDVQQLLTFEELPTATEIRRRADALAAVAASAGATEAMIGGAPYLMPHLEQQLAHRGIQPLYAFSVRESVEQAQPDGSVRKVAVFRHMGFVSGQQMDGPNFGSACAGQIGMLDGKHPDCCGNCTA